MATQEGLASYYSQDFQGRKTADGETFDNSKLTAAHRTYPFGTIVRVTNLTTDAAVEVRINDRGPVKQERVIDLTLAAAKAIGIDRAGLGRVRLDVVEWGKRKV
jgi:rare lipoprotein A